MCVLRWKSLKSENRKKIVIWLIQAWNENFTYLCQDIFVVILVKAYYCARLPFVILFYSVYTFFPQFFFPEFSISLSLFSCQPALLYSCLQVVQVYFLSVKSQNKRESGKVCSHISWCFVFIKELFFLEILRLFFLVFMRHF